MKENQNAQNNQMLKSYDIQSDEKKCLQVRFCWQGTTVDIGHFQQPRQVTVGQHNLDDFRFSLSDKDNNSFPLITPTKSGEFGIFFTDTFQGQCVQKGQEPREIASMSSEAKPHTSKNHKGYLYSLQENERFTLKKDELEIECEYVSAAEYVSKNNQKQRDFMFWRLASFSAVAHFALILMFQFVPTGTEVLSETLVNGRFHKAMHIEVPKRPKAPIKPLKRNKPKPKKKLKEVPKTNTKVTRKTSPTKLPKTSRERVMNTGLLAELGGGGPGGGSLFGKNTLQNNLKNILGASTKGGYSSIDGISGHCFGSNCTGGGGSYGEPGGGDGGWDRGDKKYGRKNTRLKNPGRRRRPVQIAKGGRVVFVGSLTKAQIKRVVRMYWFQIKYCYEKQLVRNRRLSGKIKLKWLIDARGMVQTATVIQTTMNNENVENCLVRRVLRWKFPRPKGNGIVSVTYPFIFNPASR